MKPRQIISAILCSVIQVLVFGFSWDFVCRWAEGMGRGIRAGYRISFGISVQYAFVLWTAMVVLTAFLATSKIKLKYRVGIILLASALWFCLWLFPCDAHPIRGLVFGLLGVAVHIFGSGVLILLEPKGVKQLRGLEPVNGEI